MIAITNSTRSQWATTGMHTWSKASSRLVLSIFSKPPVMRHKCKHWSWSPTCTVHDAIKSLASSFFDWINWTVFLLHNTWLHMNLVIFLIDVFIHIHRECQKIIYSLIAQVFRHRIRTHIIRVQCINDFFVAQHATVRFFGRFNFAHQQFTEPWVRLVAQCRRGWQCATIKKQTISKLESSNFIDAFISTVKNKS